MFTVPYYLLFTTANNKIGVVVYFPNGSIVAPGEKLTFQVTYTIGKDLDSKTDWKNLINFQFGINVNSIDAATDIVVAKFLNILNTTSTYNELIEVLDDKFDGNQEWTSNYIGNVGNAVNICYGSCFDNNSSLGIDLVRRASCKRKS